MEQLRVSNGFYIEASNIPVNTFKSVCFNRLKNKFQAVLVTQTVDEENSTRCTHHIAIQNEYRVSLYCHNLVIYVTINLNKLG